MKMDENMYSSKDWINFCLTKDAIIYNKYILPDNQILPSSLFSLSVTISIALSYMQTVTVSCI